MRRILILDLNFTVQIELMGHSVDSSFGVFPCN